MTIFSIGELIELAIGSPEPGHVNFIALQCLLHSFADKMHILHDKVDMTDFMTLASSLEKMPSKVILPNTTTKALPKSKKNSPPALKKPPPNKSSKNATSVSFSKEITNGNSDSSQGIISARSTTSSSARSPRMHRALAAIIERRFGDKNGRRCFRLSGGADEPQPAEESKPEGETATPAEVPPAAEETTAEQPAEAQEEQPAEVPETATADAPAPEAEAQATEPTAAEVPAEPVPEPEPAPEATASAAAAMPTVTATDTYQEEPPQIRLSRLQLPMNSLPEDLRVGIAIMKDQLELAMEELAILTALTINNKIDPQRLGHLRRIASRLRAIQRDNVYIEGTHRAKLEEMSISWLDEGEGEMGAYEEAITVEEESEPVKEEEKTSSREPSVEGESEQERYDLGLHVCYSPEKMLEQVMDLKSEFCGLTNKVHEIAAQLLKHDSHRMMMILSELQEQMRELKHFSVLAKEVFDRFESDRAMNTRIMDEMRKDIESLQMHKIDRSEVEVLLSEKVDYQQLARKVNTEQLQQLQCRMERQFCEVNKLICLTERGLKAMIEELRTTLGFNAVEEILKKWKAGIDADICAVAQKLQKYIDATNDDCAAAGARCKVLQDVACVSCDTECVMRTAERNRVPKMKSAHTTDTIAPLVTYELSSIRKSGIMGYFRKDEFPDSPNAWLKRQGTNAAMKMCVPRHAGGAHTTYTARERVDKILMNKKQ